MKITVIGGQGHIGSYLVVKLVEEGHNVVSVSRGTRDPYFENDAWKKVTCVYLDREKEPDFEKTIASFDADVVIDLINFTHAQCVAMVEALQKTNIKHYVYCSSIWAHGRAEQLPFMPESPKDPIDEYGLSKYESELFLIDAFESAGFPSTIIMPGQISGPYWDIINPHGNLNTDDIQTIVDGGKTRLPHFGMETLHHVHADDVAQMFVDAINHREDAIGQRFHAVSDQSISLYGYTMFLYKKFKKHANIEFLSWEDWSSHYSEEDIEKSYLHLARSGSFSIENAKTRIGYQPKYTIEEVIDCCMDGYIQRGVIKIR